MKYTRLRRIAPLLLAVLLVAALCLPIAAIDPSYEPSAVYRRSTYYQNLKSLPKTGNGAFDTLSVALSQLSYHEGASTSDFDGENASSSGNYTEYNYALGKVGGSYSYAWCAAFVSWCLSQAGEGDSAGGAFASCTLWVEKLQTLGRYSKRSSGYTPKSGDLIFFRSSGTARASDHVGLVRYVTGGRVYTVEGNSSGRVALRDYALGDAYIAGYGRPTYRGSAKQISRLAAEDSATGWYTVTYDFLNVRTARSAAAQKAGTLDEGDLIKILEVQDGWGRIVYKQKTAYVSLEYVDFVAPLLYRIRYISEEKTLLERELYSTEALTVAAFTPEREGYRFLHWADASGGSYLAADKLPAGDITLRAVWEILPPPVEEPPEEENSPDQDSESGEFEEGLPESGEFPDIEAVLPPLPLDPSPEEAIPIGPDAPDLRAVRHAGVVSALLALCCAGVWLALRGREE